MTGAIRETRHRRMAPVHPVSMWTLALPIVALAATALAQGAAGARPPVPPPPPPMAPPRPPPPDRGPGGFAPAGRRRRAAATAGAPRDDRAVAAPSCGAA